MNGVLHALLVAIAGVAFVAPAIAHVTETAQTPRALWVWNTAAIRQNPAVRSAFFTFIEAPLGHKEREITTLYFDGLAPADFARSGTQRSLQLFLTEAHKRRLRVEFLCGASEWAKASLHEEALSNLRAVLTYNEGVPSAARFDGFQYDVEPYLLKEWPSPELRRDYLLLLDKAMAMIRSSDAPLVLGAAVPRFFSNPSTGYLVHEVLDRIDYVALMDYVDTPDRLVTDAVDAVSYATKVGKKVWIGVETQELKDEPRATFFAVGNAAMEEAFAAAEKRFGKDRGFGGFAIHHWGSYPALRK